MRRRGIGPNLNWQVIVPVVGGTLLAIGIGMALCFVVAVVGGDGGALAFGAPAAVITPLALLGVLSGKRLRSMPLRSRDGFFAVTMAWLLAAAAGTAPFVINGTFDSVTAAFFESMSGITTTGATLLDAIEEQPDSILLWRSLTQWLGGVGIVVLVVAIAPATGLAGGHRVFFVEATGVTAQRLTPRIADTAKIIWTIYTTLTTACVLAYWAAGMSIWDAFNHGLTTLASGGFSTRTASLQAFDSLAIELVAIVFMASAGVNFAFYWLALRNRKRLWPQAAEVRAYFLIIACFTAAFATALVVDEQAGTGRALRDSTFTVVSIMTSTGYTTADFDSWHNFARFGILVLMFIGGCAGSTAGGMKVIRIMLLARTAGQELERQLRPKAVQVLRVRGAVYSENVRRGVLGFFYLYLTVFAFGVLVMAALGLDEITAISSVAASLNVIGPALGAAGPTENFGAVPDAGLWFLSALMLIGRLEIFTVLVLLTPAFWRPNVA